MILDLKLSEYQEFLDIRKSEKGKVKVFDPIRKKEIVLLPEEMVRQLIVQFLLRRETISPKKIQVEKKLDINKMPKRYDIIVFDQNYEPILLVECKSHKVRLDQSTFRQIASYNLSLKVPYLMISNGIETYLCAMDYEKNSFSFLDRFPPLHD